jgi:hypothetical protein
MGAWKAPLLPGHGRMKRGLSLLCTVPGRGLSLLFMRTPPLHGDGETVLSWRMKVAFTQKEYARLLELVHLGLWVAGARPDDPATMPERYAAIAQKAFALAEPFGCADLVEMDVNGQFFPNEKLTTGPAREKIDQFMEDSFWSELVGRLAERDLRAELDATKLAKELSEDEEERLAAIEDSYWREFETKGVDHLRVLRGGKG